MTKNLSASNNCLDQKEYDPLQPHRHDPNPLPPAYSPDFTLELPSGKLLSMSPEDLAGWPQTTVADCYIVSTGHGTSGPFVFSGVSLNALVLTHLKAEESWSCIEAHSADGFGTRIFPSELQPDGKRQILLATQLDGKKLTREQGLIRLIVPSETDDALRQVKWIARLRVCP